MRPRLLRVPRARDNNCPETERPQLAATALGQSVTPRPEEDLWWGVTEGREDRIKKGVVRGKTAGHDAIIYFSIPSDCPCPFQCDRAKKYDSVAVGRCAGSYFPSTRTN